MNVSQNLTNQSQVVKPKGQDYEALSPCSLGVVRTPKGSMEISLLHRFGMGSLILELKRNASKRSQKHFQSVREIHKAAQHPHTARLQLTSAKVTTKHLPETGNHTQEKMPRQGRLTLLHVFMMDIDRLVRTKHTPRVEAGTTRAHKVIFFF